MASMIQQLMDLPYLKSNRYLIIPTPLVCMYNTFCTITPTGADANISEGRARINNCVRNFPGHAHKTAVTSTNSWSKASFQRFWCIFIVSFMVSLSLEARGGGYSSVVYKKRCTFGAGGGGLSPFSPPPVSAPAYFIHHDQYYFCFFLCL